MSVNKLKDGRWIVNHKVDGKHKRIYFGRGPDAEQNAKKFHEKLPLRKYTKPVKAELQLRNRPVAESAVTERLAFYLRLALGGDYVETEIKTRSGIIDVVTPFEIIEVKAIIDWKGGLGQILAYGTYANGKRLRLHLFNKEEIVGVKKVKDHWQVLTEICNVCAAQNVYVSFDEPAYYKRLEAIPSHRSKPEFLVYPIQIGDSAPKQAKPPGNQLQLPFSKFIRIGHMKEGVPTQVRENSVTCEFCGKAFTSDNAPQQLKGHLMACYRNSHRWSGEWKVISKGKRRKAVLNSFKITETF